MANIRRRKFHRVPEALNETITPQGIFISNDYKDKIAIAIMAGAVLLFLQGLLAGVLIKRR